MSMETYYKNYLSHHGIRGQRWGKKNGPPYPLGDGDHSASEKKAGWKRSLNKYGSSNKIALTDKQKKALIVAGVASVAIVGGIALYKSGVLNPMIERAIDSGAKFVKSGSSDIKLNKIQNTEDLNKAVDRAKDVFKEQTKQGIDGNCTNIFSQMAAEMNGDASVKAGSNTWNSISDISKYFTKDGQKFDFDDSSHYLERKTKFVDSSQKIKDLLNTKFEDGQWGYISTTILTPKGSPENHTMLWTKLDGKINISDGRYGTRAEEYFDKLIRPGYDILIARFDDYDQDISKMVDDNILERIAK